MEYLNHYQEFCTQLSIITKLLEKVIIIKCYYSNNLIKIHLVSPYLYNISNVGTMKPKNVLPKIKMRVFRLQLFWPIRIGTHECLTFTSYIYCVDLKPVTLT